METLLLFVTGFIAGVVNSVAGGGALVIFPLLISMGLTPKLANTTTSIGVYGGQMSSAYGYKKFLRELKDPRLVVFLCIGLFGGAIGAFALDRTSSNAFSELAPWFVLFAVTMLTVQPYLSRWISSAKRARPSHTLWFLVLCTIAACISVYGGFFGAGMGIMIFAVLGFAGLSSVHQINGVKNLMTIAINTAANIYFIASGLVSWEQAGILFAASAAGGLIGSKNAPKLSSSFIRGLVIVSGLTATVILFRN